MNRPQFSIIVTAPGGLASCLYLDEFDSGTADGGVEVLVVHCGSEIPNSARPGLRLVTASGPAIQDLIAAGLGAARGEWGLVTEDHCRPLPGLLSAYRKAIAANPLADLFGGAAVNRTSTSSWSEAVFLTGLKGQWADRGEPIDEPANANMLVRMAALERQELEPGGLLNLAVPRLIAAGRYAECREAVVDHVLQLSRAQALSFQYHCARDCHDTGLALRSASPAPAGRSGSRLQTALRVIALDPLRTAKKARGSPLAKAGLFARLVVLGLVVVAAVGSARRSRRVGGVVVRSNAHARLAQ